MSRIGNRPIYLNDGVSATIEDNTVVLKSTKGEARINLSDGLRASISDNAILLTRDSDAKQIKSLHGLESRLISNANTGLSVGIKKLLEFKGTGYRAKTEGHNIILNMGYSHEIILNIPDNVEVAVGKNTISITGVDAQVVGNFAAKIREVRPPEVYKGKGIKYNYEVIKRKDGKASQGGKG